MYSYKYDTETGGLLLIDTLSQFSKEPRPVYSRELDLLGFDKIWKYEKTDEAPYLWAEAQFYFYRGKRVAKTIGGSLYERPNIELETDETGNEILPEGSILQPVDVAAMVEKNHNLIEILECEAVKKIYDVYKRYSKKLDCFHVAFSGGKDSIVLLELVKRALPANSFIVVFGDTGMEFPDTYETVNVVEAQCKADGVAFYRASSHLKPEESWRLFGPPSRVLRWCCSVHKSVPQTLKLREILGKNDYSGMDFVGVRAHESVARSDYEYENFGKKQKGQYSYNPLLEWGSAEVWLYIYRRKLPINTAYKKGNGRVGCIFCPLGSGGKSDWFRQECYPNEVRRFTSLIRSLVLNGTEKGYIENGGWVERRNGRDIAKNEPNYFEQIRDGKFKIIVKNAKTNWKEWLKTLGELPFEIECQTYEDGTYAVIVPDTISNTPLGKMLRIILHKAAYCVSCGVCETNCRNGCISFKTGVHIESCIHCGQCHNIEEGCLAFHSLALPETIGSKTMSLNTFSDHAPKLEWVRNFFAQQEKFLNENSLGRMQIAFFRRFLSDACLIAGKGKKTVVTDFAHKIIEIGWDTTTAWGLILTNLVCTNPQMRWYADTIPAGSKITRKDAEEMLQALSVSEKDARSIIKSFARLCALPLGTKLSWGEVTLIGQTLQVLSRSRCNLRDSDGDVILYALYKFAEACDGYYEFTLSRLMDFTVDSAGVSPAEIFGLSREEMEQFLNSLSRSRPEFVSYTATHDLEVIRLADDKKASDVLSLFQGARK